MTQKKDKQGGVLKFQFNMPLQKTLFFICYKLLSVKFINRNSFIYLYVSIKLIIMADVSIIQVPRCGWPCKDNMGPEDLEMCKNCKTTVTTEWLK